jgi:hypothetical protein
MTAATGNGRSEPRITVVFLLHHAMEAVADLVAALALQRQPDGADPASHPTTTSRASSTSSTGTRT